MRKLKQSDNAYTYTFVLVSGVLLRSCSAVPLLSIPCSEHRACEHHADALAEQEGSAQHERTMQSCLPFMHEQMCCVMIAYDGVSAMPVWTNVYM